MPNAKSSAIKTAAPRKATAARKSARSSNPETHAPTPILDNFDIIGNPHHLTSYQVSDIFTDRTVDGADKDYETALKFLFSYNGSSATVNAYRRELERLLQWSWRVTGRSLQRLTRDDIEAFVRFTIDPPAAWIGVKNVARFRGSANDRKANDQWRPFVAAKPKNGTKLKYTPSHTSVRQTFAVLSSFYEYMVQETLVQANPVSLIRQKSKFLQTDHDRAPVRRISNLQCCLLYTSPSPRDRQKSRMPSSA